MASKTTSAADNAKNHDQTALLIVDMLRDFTNPAGLVYYPQNREVLPRIAEVLKKFHDSKRLVIFLRHFTRANKPDAKSSSMRPNSIEGSWGDEIDDILRVDPECDYIINKRRYSGFFGTDLDLVLREHGIKNLVIVGTKTNCCIRATVTDAFNLNYEPIVVRECVATNSQIVNEVNLQDIDKYLGNVITQEELFEKLERGEL